MRTLATILLVPCLLLGVGCDSKPSTKSGNSHAHDHDHDHDHAGHEHETAATPAEALKNGFQNAIAYTQKILDAASAGDANKAHDEIHEIGFLLESLPKLAQKANVDEASQKTVKEAAASLFELIMDKIDGPLHDGKEPKYDDVKAGLEAGLAGLKKVAETLGEKK